MSSALPIDPHLQRIVESLRQNSNLVLVAEPGAGKTTRVPLALLEADLAGAGDILVLEPRRLAARMAARHVAEGVGEAAGERVGYQVRFERVAGPRTRILYVTEGIVTQRLRTDPSLEHASIVILDEFHERHLEADLCLAWLKSLQKSSRPDLKLVVMSATLAAESVAEYLECEVLRVAGRSHPVEITYLGQPDKRRLEILVERSVRRLVLGGLDGDVLVFLPGASEIRRSKDSCAEFAREHGLSIEILHGDLPAREQDRAVRPSSMRRVILSTNVAETSITIDGVVAVVDSGLARVARHSPWSGLPTLETAPISQASATQRAGRAGRTRPGVCVRLYTEHDYKVRPKHDAPEIERAELTEVVLMLRAAGIDPASFGFFEAPGRAALEAAHQLLWRLGAVDLQGIPTPSGRVILTLPVHPRLGRLALEARHRGVEELGCLAASVIAEREFRRSMRTSFNEDGRRPDQVGPSDVLARVEAFEAAERDGLDRDAIRRHDLDPNGVRSVSKARNQLLRALRAAPPLGSPIDSESDEEALLIATLTAFPDRVGKRRANDSPEIVFESGGSGRMAPTSVVHDAEIMVAVEVVEQRRGGALIRVASAIEAEWLLELFPDAVREEDRISFNTESKRVERVRSLHYGDLLLDESRRQDAEGPEARDALLQAAVAAGPAAFCDGEALRSLGRRLAFASEHSPELGPLTDEQIQSGLRSLCENARGFSDLRALSLVDLLKAQLGPKALALLDRLAPVTIPLPGRRQGAPIHYEADRPPWIASRMQDFFGLNDGPKVASGRVALVLHLLAPNDRAVQVTTDLSGFWDRHYPAIRKELMRRYPRHHFPENPRTAEPRRLKPR